MRSYRFPLLASLSLCALLSNSCSNGHPSDQTPPIPTRSTTVRIDAGTVVATLSPRFLSFAVDTAQVVGAPFWASASEFDAGKTKVERSPYDFGRPRLRALSRALSPAYLRIGGTDADRVFYDMNEVPAKPPTGFNFVLTRKQFDALNTFAIDLGFQVMFTLNAGPASRDSLGHWTSDNARALMTYGAGKKYPISHWELGNEVNAFSFVFGPSARVRPADFINDVATARALVDSESMGARLVAPASAYFPKLGEVPPFIADFLAKGTQADVISWHFYPMQSRRCPLLRRADLDTALDPITLDEISKWAAEVESLRDAHAPKKEVWLGETGNAQCGGEPLVSDAFAGSFWWVDQLGLLAKRGEPVVVRQTLSGSNYGLIDDVTLEPNPDYWASVLWKRWMGDRVLSSSISSSASSAPSDPLLRTYAHCAGADAGAPKGSIAMALINLDRVTAARVTLSSYEGTGSAQMVLTAPTLDARTIRANDVPIASGADGTLPQLITQHPTFAPLSTIVLPPASIAFVLVDAQASVCR
ncbi:MAG: hypothetical protein NVSMB1_00350 [Polyangiales bacterium]